MLLLSYILAVTELRAFSQINMTYYPVCLGEIQNKLFPDGVMLKTIHLLCCCGVVIPTGRDACYPDLQTPDRAVLPGT